MRGRFSYLTRPDKACQLSPHPPQCAHWGTCPYPLCPFGTTSLPLLAFGHFPLTGGISPLTRGVGPLWGGRLLGCSNRGGLVLLWDVWIHILGIVAECACWGRAARCAAPTERRFIQVGILPPHPPPSGAPSPRGEGLWSAHCAPLRLIYKRLYTQEKGQVWDLSLQTQRRSESFAQNFFAYFLFQRK